MISPTARSRGVQIRAPVSDTWQGFFDFAAAGRRLLADGHLGPGEAEMLASLPRRVSGPLAQARCRLLHTDLRNNLILHPCSRRIRAVLDYTESCAGDPRWELAYFDYWFVERTVHYLPFRHQAVSRRLWHRP